MKGKIVSAFIAFIIITGAYIAYQAVAYSKCKAYQPGQCESKTCNFSFFGAGVRYEKNQNCCGNKMCELSASYTETQQSCSADCSQCDDKNLCTKDVLDYSTGKCTSDIIPNCCGNQLCESASGYKETNTSCSQDCRVDCNDGKACTKDELDYSSGQCRHEIIRGCCGNNICEAGESPLTCKEDCNAQLEISNIELRVNGDERQRYTWTPYRDGNMYAFDELYADSNVAEIRADIRNTGNTAIKDLYATYECMDEEYQIYSINICWTIPNEMVASMCEHHFTGAMNGLVLKGGADESDIISHMPPQAQAKFVLYIAPLSDLEHFRETHDKDLFHPLTCKINILSETSGINERITVKNYRVRPDITRFR
ncbi:MAG: hypothetical protein Q7S16_03510 [bacterium]|nr:hypothetical protein [bacterium]